MANNDTDVLEVELRVSDDKINPTIDKSRANLTKFVGEVNSTKFTIGQHFSADFDTIEKRANTLRTTLQNVAKERINSGNIGAFTKEIVGASERVRTLQKEITDIQKRLERPTSTTFAQYLQRDLKAATAELGALETKLGRRNLLTPAAATIPQSGPKTGRSLSGLSNVAGTALDLAGSPVGAGDLNAVSSVADHLGVTLPAIETAIGGISSGFLLTAGAVAAAGLIAIQYSRSVREEAERNLKVQIALGVALGEQQVAITKAFDDLQQNRQWAEQDRDFNKDLQSRDTDFLKRKRDTLLAIQQISDPLRAQRDALGQIKYDKNNQIIFERDPEYDRKNGEITQLDTRLASKDINEAVQRVQDFTKLGEAGARSAQKQLESIKEKIQDPRQVFELQQAIESALSQAISNGVKVAAQRAGNDVQKLRQVLSEALKTDGLSNDAKDSLSFEIGEQIRKAVDEGKAKVKELGKQFNLTFDGLFAQQDESNPFARVFRAGDDALTKLRENLRGAGPELLAIGEDMQKRANDLAVFNTSLDTRLNALSLREDADNFRNPKNPGADKAQRDDLVNRYINGWNSAPDIARRNYGQTLAASVGGQDKLTDEQKRSIYEVGLFRSIQDVDGKQKPYMFGLQDKDLSLNERSLVTGLAHDRLAAGQNLTVQQRLEKAFTELDSESANTQDKKDAVNRRIIALTQGLNPNDLTANERDRAAASREAEADRLSKAKTNAVKEEDADRAVRKQIADLIPGLIKIAEALGEKGIEALIRVQDETAGKKVKGVEDNKRPSGKSTDDYYNRK